MKQPRFGLLLNLATSEEEEARRALGVKQRSYAEVEALIASLEDQRRNAVTGGIAWRDAWSAWWLRVDQEIAGHRQRLRRIEVEIDKARQRLAEAHRKVRTWERLRERDQAVIAQAAERRAARELDDLGLRSRGDR
jgi:flagellar export protein FliJ